MRVLFFATAFVIFGPIVASVYADGWANAGRSGPRLSRDEVLVGISPPVALLQSTLRYRMESSCETAEFLRATVLVESGAPDRKFLNDFIAGIASECALLQAVVAETDPFYMAIGEAGLLPSETFSFGLFVYDPNLKGNFAGYAEETVGLFADSSACDRLESLARDLGLPTRKCALWNEADLL